jgi:hypothetical protein
MHFFQLVFRLLGISEKSEFREKVNPPPRSLAPNRGSQGAVGIPDFFLQKNTFSAPRKKGLFSGPKKTRKKREKSAHFCTFLAPRPEPVKTRNFVFPTFVVFDTRRKPGFLGVQVPQYPEPSFLPVFAVSGRNGSFPLLCTSFSQNRVF